MYIFKKFLKISLKRLCSLSSTEICIANNKKFCTTCFVSQALPVNPGIIDWAKTETGYFRHYVATDPSFTDIYINESTLQENAGSTNELVLFLRNMTQNTVTTKDDSKGFEPSLYHRFARASYTVLDFIEIFYYFMYFGSVREKLLRSDFIKILSRRMYRIKYESHRRMLTLFLLIAHNKEISTPRHWIHNLVNSLSLLTKSELVAAFYVLSQKQCKMNNDTKLAELLMTHLKEMTANEVATIACGCFKQSLCLGAGVGEILLDFLVKNIKHLNSIQVGAISKCAYLMHNKYKWEKVNQLHEKAFSASDRFTISTLVHLAKLKADRNFFPLKYMDALSERLMKKDRPRLKDIERFLMIKIHRSSDLLESHLLNFIEETVSKWKEDCQIHPKAFISLVHYLVVLNVFKEDWISSIFASEYMDKLFYSVNQNSKHELCSIDCSLELERPSYKGSRYPSMNRSTFLRKNYERNFSGLMSRSTYELNSLLIEIFGAENVICRNVLPHFPYPYSLMCFENGREPLPVPTAENNGLVEWVSQKGRGDAAFVPNFPKFRSDSWLVFFIKSPEVTADGENLNLMAQFKMRQLKALGLNPVTVDFSVLEKLEEYEEKKHYVVNIVNEGVKSINNARGTGLPTG